MYIENINIEENMPGMIFRRFWVITPLGHPEIPPYTNFK